MQALLLGFLAALVPKILTVIWQREDVRKSVKYDLFLAVDAAVKAAQDEVSTWKAAAFADPARASRLRADPDTPPPRLEREDLDPPGGAR